MAADGFTTDRAQAAAGIAAYGLMAHGFRYPDSEWLTVLADPVRWHAWPESLPESHREAQEPLAALRRTVEGLEGSAASAQLQEQFAFLFGHAVRGKCPPYELEFGKSEVIQRASDLADISGFFAAFGMHLAGDISERPDHISVESEFMAVLCAKATCGFEREDGELIDTAHRAQKAFLKAHLGRWLPAFVRRVREHADGGFYGALAGFADVWVACDCQRFGLAAGSPYLQLRPVDPVEEGTQSCGPAGACGGDRPVPLTQLNVAIGSDG